MELEDVYPVLHAMLHVAPLAKVPLQVPVPPFATEKLAGMVQLVEVFKEALHRLGEHVAAVNVPNVQVEGPDTV